jgi:hypothetical protein
VLLDRPSSSQTAHVCRRAPRGVSAMSEKPTDFSDYKEDTCDLALSRLAVGRSHRSFLPFDDTDWTTKAPIMALLGRKDRCQTCPLIEVERPRRRLHGHHSDTALVMMDGQQHMEARCCCVLMVLLPGWAWRGPSWGAWVCMCPPQLYLSEDRQGAAASRLAP